LAVKTINVVKIKIMKQVFYLEDKTVIYTMFSVNPIVATGDMFIYNKVIYNVAKTVFDLDQEEIVYVIQECKED
jgi:hypothetical protein